jgi:hypothetical protein
MNIIIKRGQIMSLSDLPDYSIAIDGFVSGPAIDVERHRYSFDHHAGCLRFCTSSACMQSRDAVLLGLNPDKYTIYCNDVDSDVCVSIWCLSNPTRCKEPLVEKLINAIGKGDMFAGAIEINGMKKVVEWICEPQTSSIRNGDYEKLSDEGLKPILESMLHRIDLYVNGEAGIEVAKQQYHEEFKVLRQENGWALIESEDPHILSTVWHSGFERVVIVRPLADKSTAVTIARKSDFIENFPIDRFYIALNSLEPGWGGSSSIGGAPRNSDGSRSHLSVKKIIEVIDSVLLDDKRRSGSSSDSALDDRRSTKPPKKTKKNA